MTSNNSSYMWQWKSMAVNPLILTITAAAVFIHVCFLLAYRLAPAFFAYLTKEDGVFEYTQVLFYLLSSILFMTLLTRRDPLPRRIWLVIFALGFLFIAGDEMSWGQRIFGFHVKAVEELSVQNEFNLHNLGFIRVSPSKMLTIISLSFGVLLPITLALSRTLRTYILDRLQFPAPHPAVVPIFLLSFLWYKAYHPDSPFPVVVEESRETTIALGFFVFAVLFRMNYGKTQNPHVG